MNTSSNDLIVIIEKEVTPKEFFQNLIPNLGSEFIFFCITMLEIHFIGLTGNNELLAAIGLAQSYNLLLLFFMGFGIIEVMDTICSRSFGKNEFYQLGVHTNQIRLIISVYVTFISIINFFFADKILSIIGKNASFISDSHLFIQIVTPSILLSIHYEIYCKYYETQLVYKPVITSLLIAVVVHPFNCWFFISHLNYGIVGAGIATNITEFIRFSYIFMYSNCCNPYPKSNVCFNRDVFKKFWIIVKQAIASAALYFGENAGYNIVDFMSATFGPITLAQHIALMNITMITFAFSGGFMKTNAILTGLYAGKNSPSNVIKIIKISLLTSVGVTVPILIIIAIFPLEFLKFFSRSKDVWNSDGMRQIVYIMCISNFFDFQQYNIQGYLRGLGIFNITFFVSFISYCFVLPLLCYFFAIYLNFRLYGIFSSMILVNLVVFVINLTILVRSDIVKLCEDYEDKNEKGIEDGKELEQIESPSILS